MKICVCDHNVAEHRHEWNPFRSMWDTSCNHTELSVTGRDRCRCDKFEEAA